MLKKFSLLPLSVFSELFGVVVLDDELTAAYKTKPIKLLYTYDCVCAGVFVCVCVCVCVMHKREGWVCAQLPIPYKWVKLNTFINTLLVLFVHLLFVHTQINNNSRTTQTQAHNYISVRMFLLVCRFFSYSVDSCLGCVCKLLEFGRRRFHLFDELIFQIGKHYGAVAALVVYCVDYLI